MLQNHSKRNERGLSLIEVLMAMALAGILSVTIPSALSIANKTTTTGARIE